MKANLIKNLAQSAIFVLGFTSCGSEESHNQLQLASPEEVRGFVAELKGSVEEDHPLFESNADIEVKSAEIVSAQIDLVELKIVYCSIQNIRRDDGSTILAGLDALDVALGFLSDRSFDFTEFKNQKAHPACLTDKNS